MHFQRLSRVLVISLAVIAFGSPVHADEQQLAEARRLFYEGNTQYRLANFEEALDLFKRSLEKVTRPNTIFNIAQCHRQLKQTEEALFHYKLYLSEWERRKPGTDPPHLEEVEQRIAELEAEIEQTRQEEQRKEEQARKEKQRRDQAKRPAEQKRLQGALADKPRSTPSKPSGTAFYKKWWFWTIVGVAVVGGTTAGVVAGTQSSSEAGVMGTIDPGQVRF